MPQSSYALADADNVQVTLDLSSVRAAGTQEVPLRATTTYGQMCIRDRSMMAKSNS